MIRYGKGVIAWFASNPVAANLMVITVMVAGLTQSGRLEQTVIPDIEVEAISVLVPYPGAAPAEVEEGICARVEEALLGLDGVKRVRSTAQEGAGTVLVELLHGHDRREALDEIKAKIDRIEGFPEEAEDPIVTEVELDLQVLDVAVWGPLDGKSLRRVAEQVRDGLTALPEISLVRLANAPPYEISVELSEERMRALGLSFDEVALAVRRAALDLPGGSLKTAGGEILLRSKGQVYSGEEFAALPLRTLPDGRRLLLGEVAAVVDGFADTDQKAFLNGQPAVYLSVYRVGEQSALKISKAARAHLAAAEASLPEGVHLTVVNDDSRVLRDRLDLMLRNARAGLILVFITLALFMRLRLALWVTAGIPVAVLGTIWLMPALGQSINMISLFAFILVLGIVVDDAIVVSENIYSHRQRGKSSLQAAADGAREIGVAVVFSVLTTVAAFLPMLFQPGIMGQFARIIPIIIVPTLLFSLCEALWALPAHLRHLRNDAEDLASGRKIAIWDRAQSVVDRGLQAFIDRAYRPSLDWALRWRYLTLAASLGILLVTLGLVGGGRIHFVFFPPIEADNVVAELTMPLGAPLPATEAVVRRLETTARGLQAELADAEGRSPIRNVIVSIGGQPFKQKQDRYSGLAGAAAAGSHLAEVNLELMPAEERTTSSSAIAARWRDKVGAVAGVTELSYNVSITSSGADVDVLLAGPDLAELREAAAELKEHLASYQGVYDVADSFREGKRELKLLPTTEGQSLGVNLGDLARQVRQAFYGEEAQRLQRGRDEVKVMVRYTQAERRSAADLENLRVRTPDGRELPLTVVAQVSEGRGEAAIQRVDRQRGVSVTAAVHGEVANADQILGELARGFLPELARRHPGLQYSFEGQKREQSEFLEGLKGAAGMALVAIFALLAIPLRSYLQPLIIMAAIPFGVVGAVWGHVLVGMDLVIFSVIGVVALAGIAVNDSLVMIDFINRAREEEGRSLEDAARNSGAVRFRAILLTSLTTFASLVPLLIEKSLQAQFIMPMAVSLGFGVLFATFITLFLVPCLYLVLEDVRRGLGWAWRGATPPAAARPELPAR